MSETPGLPEFTNHEEWPDGSPGPGSFVTPDEEGTLLAAGEMGEDGHMGPRPHHGTAGCLKSPASSLWFEFEATRWVVYATTFAALSLAALVPVQAMLGHTGPAALIVGLMFFAGLIMAAGIFLSRKNRLNRGEALLEGLDGRLQQRRETLREDGKAGNPKRELLEDVTGAIEEIEMVRGVGAQYKDELERMLFLASGTVQARDRETATPGCPGCAWEETLDSANSELFRRAESLATA